MVKINNKSLIQHLFYNLKKSKKIDEIFCSTDSKKIINHCKKIGLDYEIREKNFLAMTLIFLTIYFTY